VKSILLFLLFTSFSFEVGSVSFAEFYQGSFKSDILPEKNDTHFQSAPLEKSASVTLVYDSEKKIEGNELISVEINGQSETNLNNQQTLTLALKPGKYTFEVSAGRSNQDRDSKTYSLLPDNHLRWSIPAFDSHLEPPEVIVPII